jgi:hypothetical protein
MVSEMVNTKNKGRGILVALGVTFVISLLIGGALLMFASGKPPVDFGQHIYGFLADHLKSPLALPTGVFYLLLGSTIAALTWIGRAVFRKWFGKDEVWRQYRMDNFFWAEWQWDYTWKGKVINLWCECERCAEPMLPKVVPDGEDEVGVRFICNQCGKQSTTIRSSEDENTALDRVEKKILRNIRVGKYPWLD